MAHCFRRCCSSNLLGRDMGYNEEAAKSLVDTYKATLSFAGLDKPDEIGDSMHVSSNKLEEPAAKVSVGVSVQWTSSGVDQFTAPQKVVAISDDGKWLWVEGSQSAIPVNEVTVMNTESLTPTPPPPPASVLAAMAAVASAKAEQDANNLKPGSRRAVFPVDGGDVTLIFPEDITGDGLAELGQYLEIFLKKKQKKKGGEQT